VGSARKYFAIAESVAASKRQLCWAGALAGEAAAWSLCQESKKSSATPVQMALVGDVERGETEFHRHPRRLR